MKTRYDQSQKLTIRNARLGLMVAGLAIGMLGLAYASVPLYKLFGSVTGYGGTPKTNVVMPLENGDVSEQLIAVALDANVNSALNWTFRPDAGSVRVRLGEESMALFRAKNKGPKAVTGTAAFNVTPFKAAQYVSKIECFCFTSQEFLAGQERPMPLQFIVAPELPDYVDTITLQYTFFDTARVSANIEN